MVVVEETCIYALLLEKYHSASSLALAILMAYTAHFVLDKFVISISFDDHFEILLIVK